MNKRLVWHTEAIRDVVNLLLGCKTKEDVEKVFDKVLTPREINDMARRHKVLTMIETGSTYTDIRKDTGMSSVTISRISMKCGYGFRKSSGLTNKQKAASKRETYKRTIRYKGVPVIKV